MDLRTFGMRRSQTGLREPGSVPGYLWTLPCPSIQIETSFHGKVRCVWALGVGGNNASLGGSNEMEIFQANVNCNLQARMFLGWKERLQVGKVNLPLWEGVDGTVLSHPVPSCPVCPLYPAASGILKALSVDEPQSVLSTKHWACLQLSCWLQTGLCSV